MVPDYLTIAEAARLIESRELSPVELVESRLDRIARLDGRLNSFIRVLGDEARRDARAAEAEIAAGKYRGPLHGHAGSRAEGRRLLGQAAARGRRDRHGQARDA